MFKYIYKKKQTNKQKLLDDKSLFYKEPGYHLSPSHPEIATSHLLVAPIFSSNVFSSKSFANSQLKHYLAERFSTNKFSAKKLPPFCTDTYVIADECIKTAMYS